MRTRTHSEADRFYADLTGLYEDIADHFEQDPEPDLKSGRVVFYDGRTLTFIEGWTRATGRDVIVLIDRAVFDPIRADGRKRSADFDEFLRIRMRGGDAQFPHYVIDNTLHTAPLNPKSRGDWDDLMIDRLAAAGLTLSIQSEADQWKLIHALFKDARRSAQLAGPGKVAQEFVAYFVVDDVSRPTLTMVRATGVTMQGNHAIIPLGSSKTRPGRFLPTGGAGYRVIGDIHTHVLLDRFIDLSSAQLGTRWGGPTMENGVSDTDMTSAHQDQIVVYAIDSRWLHRASPHRDKAQNKLPRSGNVLREALREFGREPQ